MLRVIRPRKTSKEPGKSTSELLSALDELSGMAAEFATGLAGTDFFGASDSELLNLAATGLDSYRKVGQQIMEKWMELYPLQEKLELGAMRAIEFYDSVVEAHELTELVDKVTDTLFGLASPGEKAFVDLSLDLFGAPFTGSSSGEGGETSISIGDAGFILHEGVKLIKGMENLFKAIKPSVEAGTPFFGADVEISLGELISAIAELLDIIAQVLQKMASSAASAEMKATLKRIEQSIERMEEKGDRIETSITELDEKVELFRELMIQKFQRTWSAFDKIGEVLGKTLVGEPWVFDPTTTTTGWKIPDHDVKQELHDIEDKVDRLEEKLDREEDKLDRQEEKLDRQEEKLDRIEEKHDRFEVISAPEEGTIAGQRGGGDRITALVAAVGATGGVSLRAAIDVLPADLDEESKWTDWKSFGTPTSGSPLAEVSIQAAYQEDSNEIMEALLSTRDAQGNVYHRVYKRKDDDLIINPSEWGEWKRFLNRP
jgi:archaellum component FlaC